MKTPDELREMGLPLMAAYKEDQYGETPTSEAAFNEAIARIEELSSDLKSDQEAYFRERNRADEAEAALAKLTSPEADHEGEWWCPRCEEWIPSTRVNHDETCDTCGCPVLTENPYAKLAAAEAQVARAEWKLKRLRDEGVIKDDDLASLEAVFVEFHREAQP